MYWEKTEGAKRRRRLREGSAMIGTNRTLVVGDGFWEKRCMKGNRRRAVRFEEKASAQMRLVRLLLIRQNALHNARCGQANDDGDYTDFKFLRK